MPPVAFVPRPCPLKRAADNLPGGLIAAHDAADLRVALHHAGERAADDSAVIFARDAAAGDLVAARSYRARNIQVCHASAGQNRAEQSGGLAFSVRLKSEMVCLRLQTCRRRKAAGVKSTPESEMSARAG